MPGNEHQHAMSKAKAFLHQHGVPFTSFPPHQIKIGEVNYWPGRGSIFVDGEGKRRPHRGLDALADVLQEFKYLRWSPDFAQLVEPRPPARGTDPDDR